MEETTSKYITFKREDFNEFISQWTVDEDDWSGWELEDVFVIRMQDRFAPIAIQAYTDAIANVVEILEAIPAFKDGSMLLDLRAVRDFAFSAAETARQVPKRLPTV